MHLTHDDCASMQYCRFYTQSFRFVSQYYVRLSLLSRKTSSVNLFLQLQKMLRLYTANRRLMFHVHRESKQRQTTAWMIVTIPPSWWWILVLRTQNFEFFENCIMCRGSADLLKGHGTDTPTIWAANCFILNSQVKIKEIVQFVFCLFLFRLQEKPFHMKSVVIVELRKIKADKS